MAEVGILDLEVQVNLKQAESDLDRLSDALKRVREAVGNGIRLSGVSSQISKLCKAIDENINRMVKGLMIESYIEDGCQKSDESTYGKSITDPCLGWEKSQSLILELADILRKRK